jgi:hypothetical protein
MERKKIKDIIKIDETNEISLEAYTSQAKKNMLEIFDLNNKDKQIPLKAFLENTDHGAIHTYNVFKKSLEIAKEIEEETWEKIDKTLLYVMSGMHDSGRFRLPISKQGDTQQQKQAKEKKQNTSERNHGNYGVSQIKLANKKLKEKWISLDPKEQQKIEDYIRNHDFFNTRLDGTKYQEPSSLEGQITRLADRISVPIEEEIARYRETGKRLNTVYFKPEISFQERVDFNFGNMGNYIKSGKFDEFTFFLALLSQKSEDFSHPTLAKIYQKWSSIKNKGIQTILEIAKEEGYPEKEIKEMENLIHKYIHHFWIKF